jgi:hypothetical protein
MTQYIFVATSLPALKIGEPPEISFEEFATLLKENLLPGDYKKASKLRLYYDILNMRAFWRKEPLDYHANWDFNTLEERLLNREGLPSYVLAFLDKYDNNKKRLDHFSELIFDFFKNEIRSNNGFLRKYFSFERNLRLVLVGFRTKQLNRNLAVELQYENPEEAIIGQLLLQKDAKIYEPPIGFEDLKPIFEEFYNAPMQLYQALLEYRFQKINQMVGVQTFNMDFILGYMAQLIMLEKWMELDKKKGLEIVENIVKGSS